VEHFHPKYGFTSPGDMHSVTSGAPTLESLHAIAKAGDRDKTTLEFHSGFPSYFWMNQEGLVGRKKTSKQNIETSANWKGAKFGLLLVKGLCKH